MLQEHGGNVHGLSGVLDFSANINPLGMIEGVRNAIVSSAADCILYPDPDCTELREALGIALDFSPEKIVCGNGAADLIYRTVHAFRPKKALICAPTFAEYMKALRETECSVDEHYLLEEDGFSLTESILPKLSGYDMVILCSPNNPTGQIINTELLERIAEICSESKTILVCDECFLGFVPEKEKYSLLGCLNKNCIVISALTKLYAIPGIRLGYAVCGCEENAEILRHSGQYWSVSVPAQAAGLAALAEDWYVERTADYISRERKYMTDELKKCGADVYASDANFLLIKADPDLYEQMFEDNILIRSCESFNGLGKEFFRIAIRTHDENRRFVESFRRRKNG